MNSRFAILLAAAPLAFVLPGCASDDKPKTEQAPLTYEDSVEATVTARVRAIDHAMRMITIEDAAGHWLTFAVDDQVKRLNEVMVGDNVKAQYRAKLLAELRSATVAEAANPITVTETEQRTAQGASPSRSATKATKVVTTVEAVDVPNMLVTLRGPMGDRSVVRGRNPDNVKKLRVGDTVVITFTETVAISLDKLAAR